MIKQILLLLLIFTILSVNFVAFMLYRKMKNIYLSAFIILILAGVLGVIEGIFAMIILDDGFGFFFGLNLVGYYLLLNSLFVFLIAIIVSIIKIVKRLNCWNSDFFWEGIFSIKILSNSTTGPSKDGLFFIGFSLH
jgi:uncharacterized membrane protein YfcA